MRGGLRSLLRSQTELFVVSREAPPVSCLAVLDAVSRELAAQTEGQGRALELAPATVAAFGAARFCLHCVALLNLFWPCSRLKKLVSSIKLELELIQLIPPKYLWE